MAKSKQTLAIWSLSSLAFMLPFGAGAETTALNFTPRSTSYQPQSKGEMTSLRSASPTSAALALAENPERMKAISEGSLARKFDIAGKMMFGDVRPFNYEQMLASRHIPSATHWAGYCHQWAAGALDGELSRLAESTGGLVCKDVYFSLPELRELITAFYMERGQTIGHMRVPDEAQTKIRNETGIDPLQIDEFHYRLHSTLARNRGVVLNVGLKGQVWNYPVYQASSSYRPVSIQSYDGPILDPHVFLDNSLLAEYRRIYTAMYDEVHADDDQRRIPVAQVDAYIARAKALFTQMKPFFDPTIEILETETQATHAGVSSFASGEQSSSTAKFSYVVAVRRDSRIIVTGAWRTNVSRETFMGSFFHGNGRPGTMWFPEPMGSYQVIDMAAPTSANSANPQQELAMRALVNMMNQCRPLRGASAR